ncbi:MAG: hypothetical protein J6O88_02480 [Chryseobacterium sp.]|uniref:hypothetical protein n=1 Tax=Chryseobacterium sp. TaxID=1871047 RepID=UPI001B2832A8|nr:hypothetical protein [Chryseobacterium sp.]MBO6183542.1 hypothetical protein [Chryseobacterium sp.]
MDYTLEKEYLKAIFVKQELEVTEETETSITFKRRSLLELNFPEDNLKSLKNYLEIKDEFENTHFETTLISKNYREELVDVINHITSRMIFWRDEKFLFGIESETELFATIDNCSDNYVWNKLENENFLNYILERVRMMRGDGDFIKFTKRMFTIKVYNSNQSSIENNLKISNSIIDSCIFSFSSLKQTTISVVEFFPKRRRTREQSQEIFKVQTHNNFNFPKIKINPHLLKFYQLASSTEFESHKFLSYYHILEYFYLSVSDQNLYDKLSRRINEPKFRTTSQNLDKLIQDINSHKTENDETEMLKSVLAKYVNEDELIEFIKEYEILINDNIYTKKKVIFGNEISGTNLQPGHVFGPISKHIKTVRNGLVHSSDRHERKDRFIPYSKSSMDTVKIQIPVLKFLAEKIIISTAE